MSRRIRFVMLLVFLPILTLACLDGHNACEILDNGEWDIEEDCCRTTKENARNRCDDENSSSKPFPNANPEQGPAVGIPSDGGDALAPPSEPLPEAESDAAAPAIEAPLPESNSASIAAGTYKGTTNIGSTWVGYWGGQVVRDEIIIIVANDGTVSGSITSLWTTGPSEPIEWESEPNGPLHSCVSNITITENGTLSGKLTGDSGKIDVQLAFNKVIERFDCPGETLVQDDNSTFQADVIISSNTMAGTMPEGFTFLATKN